jgi:acetate kinase
VARRVSDPAILVLNAGSSTLKAARYDGTDERARDQIDLDGRAHADALDELLDRLAGDAGFTPDAIGHRIVHGGPHDESAVVDDALVVELRALTPLAPLHQGPGLDLLDATRERYPNVPQIACFDSAFHLAMPEIAQRFALDERWWDAGVRRYGFHGLSFTSLLHALPEARAGRVVLAHLGSGASLAALLDGAPQDTTMGLTPTGGLVMATRSGDLDPGVVLFLARALGGDADALERAVDQDAGLLGASGTTGDARRLLAARDTDLRAALAVELFCRSVRKHIGALAAVLGGLDLLVFSGGIGEHSPEVRAQISGGLEHLGVRVDARANTAGTRDLSVPDASCRVLVVPTDEEWVIARDVHRRLAQPRDRTIA